MKKPGAANSRPWTLVKKIKKVLHFCKQAYNLCEAIQDFFKPGWFFVEGCRHATK